MAKLAVSNLAWSDNNSFIFKSLAEIGVQGVEVAPTKIAPWNKLTTNAMLEYRRLVNDYGMDISSFQAFLFNKPELQLLSDDSSFQSFIDHMSFVFELAEVSGASVLVFGAPKNRLLLDHTYESALELALLRLTRLAELAVQHSVVIGLEAVPIAYNNQFITSYHESLFIVKTVSHPGLVFHLDIGCTFLEGDDVTKAIMDAGSDLRHFHISQPRLVGFSEPENYHKYASSALQKITYDGWLCVEMLENNLISTSDLISSLSFVKRNYF